ncbi:Hypothetical predicted protein [Podarcis lilfordi]|uniref:Uncharacterized protein n=1 Tax=Podarcis lilfordi TaxID=74358 RepID=A0AA35KT80_9SAUR|nr:Hypothetical predicted protein [Podarcis lilfordi]
MKNYTSFGRHLKAALFEPNRTFTGNQPKKNKTEEPKLETFKTFLPVASTRELFSQCPSGLPGASFGCSSSPGAVPHSHQSPKQLETSVRNCEAIYRCVSEEAFASSQYLHDWRGGSPSRLTSSKSTQSTVIGRNQSLLHGR